jgi:hypothetical protein
VEEFIKVAKEQIATAEKQLAEAEKLIKVLQAQGALDQATIQAYNETKRRLETWKASLKAVEK